MVSPLRHLNRRPHIKGEQCSNTLQFNSKISNLFILGNYEFHFLSSTMWTASMIWATELDKRDQFSCGKEEKKINAKTSKFFVSIVNCPNKYPTQEVTSQFNWVWILVVAWYYWTDEDKKKCTIIRPMHAKLKTVVVRGDKNGKIQSLKRRNWIQFIYLFIVILQPQPSLINKVQHRKILFDSKSNRNQNRLAKWRTK